MLLLSLTACGPAEGPAPQVSGVTPALACDAGTSVEVEVSGAGFAPAPVDVLDHPDLEHPTLRLTQAGDLTGAAVAEPAELFFTPEDGTLRWVDAGTLAFDAARAAGMVPGAWGLDVTNPDGQVAELALAFSWADAPSVTGLSPDRVCIDSPTTLTLSGADFLVEGGVPPSVTVGGETLVATPADCAPLATDPDSSVCTTLTVEVDPSHLAIGSAEVLVTTLDTCSTTASLTVTAPPTIEAVDPAITCGAGPFVVTGSGFPDDPVVTIGGVPAAVTIVDGGTLEVTPGDGTPTGEVELVLEAAAGGCVATTTVEIIAEPTVYFVDPPVIWSGVSVQATAWIADVSAEVVEVWLRGEDGATTDLAFTWTEDEPGRVRAVVPAGLDAGDYAFGITQADGCAGALEGAFTVTDTTTVAIEAVDPAYAWEWDDTPVQVLATDPVPDGMEGFQDPPSLYVTSDDGTAAAVQGVTWRDEHTLTATIPAGLAVGTYNVLVVNPDGAVGFLADGLTVTEDRPPEIFTVSPPGLANNVDETITIRGAAFHDPSVSMTCLEDGAERTAAATVVSATGTEIEAVVPSDDFNQAVCLVTVTNADGPHADWAALSIRNPAENLFPWEVGTEMVVARRAPGAAAARTTSVERWVYAAGGDDGDTTGALRSVERAAIGVYGDLGEWELLDGELPTPLTLAAAVTIGQWVYLVGGDDGAGAQDAGWRAHVLDPEEVPRFADLSISDGALGAGTWTWRIAALYGATDVSNPGGESLAGDPIRATFPDGAGLAVTLTWETVDDAVGYRVYRSPEADSSALEWVADTVEASFFDDGQPTDPSLSPLPSGSLGEWIALPTMATARSAPCATWTADPEPDPVRVHLFVAGGTDASGDPVDTVERLDITVVKADEHETDAWVDAGVTLSEARSQCGAWGVDASRHSVVEEGEAWIYFGGGLTESRAVGTVDAGRVEVGGIVEDWGEIDSMSPGRAGFGITSASDFLYGFGGQQGAPSTGGVSGELGIEPMPEVRNWNSLGVSLTEARYLAGSAQESAVVVQAGGQTDDEAATRSTDVTRW